MNNKYLENLFLKLSKIADKKQLLNFEFEIKNNEDIYSVVDKIYLFVNDLYIDKKINLNEYELFLEVFRKIYNRDDYYIQNRIDWIREAFLVDENITLNLHHKELLSYFEEINYILSEYGIDYFHASGFMGYILSGNDLERFHHDIDIYINEKCLYDFIKVFSEKGFKVVHTFEEADEYLYRHGFKIENDNIDIPIWLSFYEVLKDGGIYVNEYYEDSSNTYFTKKNYNSPLCTELSLTKGCYNDVEFSSMSLEGIYCSKNNNRKKDIYDCKVIRGVVDMKKVKVIEKELCSEWKVFNGISGDVLKVIEQSGYRKVLKKN